MIYNDFETVGEQKPVNLLIRKWSNPDTELVGFEEPITKRMKLTATKREEDNYEISDLEA